MKTKIMTMMLIFAVMFTIILATKVSATNDGGEIVVKSTSITTTGLVGKDISSTSLPKSGSGYQIYVKDLTNRDYITCIDAGEYMPTSSKTYKVSYKMNTVYLLNNFPIEELPKEVAKLKQVDSPSSEKHVIAYILSELVKDDNQSYKNQEVQKAIWGTSLNMDSASVRKKYRETPLYQEALAYSNYRTNYESPVFTKKGIRISDDLIGEYKIKYTSASITHKNKTYTFGDIKGAELNVNGTEIPVGTGWYFADASGNRLTSTYPASEQGFYIKLESEELKNEKDISINVDFQVVNATAYYTKMTSKRVPHGLPECSKCGNQFYRASGCNTTICRNCGHNCGRVTSPVKGSGCKCGTRARTKPSQPVILSGAIRRTDDIFVPETSTPQGKTLDIEGTVWLDARVGKDLVPNEIMNTDQFQQNEGDKAVPNIIVKLHDKDNKLDPITRVTDNQGKYAFKNVAFGEYYVTFEYDGLSYAPTQKNTSGTNTSKADETEDLRNAFNNQFNIISKNMTTGTDRNTLSMSYNYTSGTLSPFKLAESKLRKLDSNGRAIYKIEAKTDLIDGKFENATENQKIENINLGLVERYEANFILMSDMTKAEVYFDGNLERETTYGVRDQNKLNEILLDPDKLAEYRNQTYSVDISEEDIKNGVQLYLTYMTVAINQSNRAAGTIKEMVEMVNKEFTLDKAWLSDGTALTCSTTSGTSYNTIHITGMDKIDPIRSGNSVTIYMRFKVDAKTAFEGIKPGESVEKISTSEISAYSFNNSANTSDSGNKDMKGSFEKAKYINGQIDKDSAPENATHKDMTTFEDDTDNAPRVYLKLVRQKNIGGVVWEDDGDGVREDNEKMIKSITVELYETSNMATPKQTVETDEAGKYVFKDLADGNYIVRFKYGNTEKTAKIKGSGGENEKSYNGYDFTNTKYMPSDARGSEAIDNTGRRTEVQTYTTPITNAKYKILTSPYKDPTNATAIMELINNTWMYADTETIVVGANHDNATRENTDFGLLEKVEAKLKVEKRVSSIKIADRNNTILVNVVIPENQAPQGTGKELVKVIPEISNPYQYNIELGTEVLTGSKVEIGYEIKVINAGNVDVTITKLFDYIDNDMTFNTANNSGWKEVLTDELLASIDSSIKNNIGSNVVAKIEGDIVLAAQTNVTINVTKNISLSATLSSDLREISYINISEIAEYQTPGRLDREEIPANKQGNDTGISEEVTINDATGEQRIYYVLGLSMLTVLIVGVAIIKRKGISLKKKQE